MKISARNILNGKVTKIVEGAVNCEVTLEIAPGIEIVSIITKASVASLGLVEGKSASAVKSLRSDDRRAVSERMPGGHHKYRLEA
jgi:molybdopterin-binding protein